MAMSTRSPRILVTLPDDLRRALEKERDETGAAITEIIRRAIRNRYAQPKHDENPDER